MSRLVLFEAQAPEQVGDKWICRCGLSKKQPFCDGSHHKTKDEESGKVYKYAGDKREEIQ